MKYGSIDKRLDLLQPEECPGCAALAALSDEELDQRIDALVASIRDGEPLPEGFQDLREHSPGCPEAGRPKDDMSAEEIEALLKECEQLREPRPVDPDKDICPWCNCRILPEAGSYTGPESGGRRICNDCYAKAKRSGQLHQYTMPAPAPDTPAPGPDVLTF